MFPPEPEAHAIDDSIDAVIAYVGMDCLDKRVDIDRCFWASCQTQSDGLGEQFN
jgi:hypothetical protein